MMPLTSKMACLHFLLLTSSWVEAPMTTPTTEFSPRIPPWRRGWAVSNSSTDMHGVHPSCARFVGGSAGAPPTLVHAFLETSGRASWPSLVVVLGRSTWCRGPCVSPNRVVSRGLVVVLGPEVRASLGRTIASLYGVCSCAQCSLVLLTPRAATEVRTGLGDGGRHLEVAAWPVRGH